MRLLSFERHVVEKLRVHCSRCTAFEVYNWQSCRSSSSFLLRDHVTSDLHASTLSKNCVISAPRRLQSTGSTSDEPKVSSLSQNDIEYRQSVTDAILVENIYPIGCMTNNFILDAEDALLSWTNEYSATGFNNSLRLLKRLVKEQEAQRQQQEQSYSVRGFLVNRVVDCWRICWRNSTVDMEPSLMISELKELEGQGVGVDNRAMTMIIEGMLKRGNDMETPLLAQWILDQRLEDAEDNPKLRPDTFLMTSVIRAWSKSGRLEAPEMAEGILDLMHELYDNGWTNSGPNFMSYAAVMTAWRWSGRPEAPDAIDRLLDRMKMYNQEGLHPDTMTYTLVIDSWAFSGNPIGAQKAQERLQEMIALYEKGNELVVPQASNFARVISALSRSGDKEMAEKLYKLMETLYKETKNPVLKPNQECKKALFSALSKERTTVRARSLLKAMVDAALAGKEPMPKRSYFVDLLVAMTRDKDPVSAARQAEEILRQMIDLAKNGYPELMPDSRSFLKVAQAWSRVRGVESVTRVEALLDLMTSLHHETGSMTLKPNGDFMQVFVATLCRSSQPNPERAAALIQEMEQAYSNGDSTMKPRRGIYTNLMQAWVRTEKPNYTAVQEIFDKLSMLYSQGHPNYRPDLMVYAILMESWARRGEPAKVQAIFDGMINDYRRGNETAKPDTRAFNIILKAWSLSENPNRAQKAETLFHKMNEFGDRAGVHLKPDGYTYVQMIKNWSDSDLANSAEKATSYLQAMIEHGFEATFMIYYDVLAAWLRKGDDRSTQHAAALLEDLLQGVQSKKICRPNARGYRQLLKSVGESNIPRRNAQALELLRKLPQGKIPQLLMPSRQSLSHQ